MTFERYMSLCLYHPEFGYYIRGLERTGMEGDYFTSSDLHPVFARLMARQAAEMWDVMGRPHLFTWVEMGAGRGLFASDFLGWSASALPDFYSAVDYVAVEPGPQRRGQIEARLTGRRLSKKVRLVSSLNDLAPSSGCFFSNELVDAFPVHVVTRIGRKLREIYVSAEDEELLESKGAISNTAVAAYAARYAPNLEDGHRMEVNLHAQDWMKAVGEKLLRGFVLTIDYGDLASRLFDAARSRGTLLAYHGHTADEGFFTAPGETDLTAHVNFSALIDAGTSSGLEFAGFTTQERFLLALGEANQFSDLYDPGQNEEEMIQSRLRLKRLISPEGMGNIFKVLLQRRGTGDIGLTGWKFAV